MNLCWYWLVSGFLWFSYVFKQKFRYADLFKAKCIIRLQSLGCESVYSGAGTNILEDSAVSIWKAGDFKFNIHHHQSSKSHIAYSVLQNDNESWMEKNVEVNSFGIFKDNNGVEWLRLEKVFRDSWSLGLYFPITCLIRFHCANVLTTLTCKSQHHNGVDMSAHAADSLHLHREQ